MADEQGRLNEEGLAADENIVKIIAVSNNSDSSVPAADPDLSHPELPRSNSQVTLLTEGGEGGGLSENSVQELEPRFISQETSQGYNSSVAYCMQAAKRVPIYLWFISQAICQGLYNIVAGSSDATQVAADGDMVQEDPQPGILDEPVPAMAVVNGVRSEVRLNSDPIVEPPKWHLSSTVDCHVTHDFTILGAKHSIPPISAPDGLQLVECGIFKSDAIILCEVKVDYGTGGNWMSEGALAKGGCNLDYEGEHCLIKKDGKVIGRAHKDNEGCYQVDEFDGSKLKRVCVGCKNIPVV